MLHSTRIAICSKDFQSEKLVQPFPGRFGLVQVGGHNGLGRTCRRLCEGRIMECSGRFGTPAFAVHSVNSRRSGSLADLQRGWRRLPRRTASINGARYLRILTMPKQLVGNAGSKLLGVVVGLLCSPCPCVHHHPGPRPKAMELRRDTTTSNIRSTGLLQGQWLIGLGSRNS